MSLKEWLSRLWRTVDAVAAEEKAKGVMIRLYFMVKKTDSGFTVCLHNCERPEEHAAVFKHVGDHYELGERSTEAFVDCVLSAVVSTAVPGTRAEKVDDHIYGFACGPDGCKPFFA